MGVVKLSTAGIVNYEKFSNFRGNDPYVPPVLGSYDLLATEILASSQSSVTFSSLGDYAADYQHLQIRMSTRDNRVTGGGNTIFTRFNGDTGANYSWHRLTGTNGAVSSGAGASQTFMVLVNVSSQDPTGSFSASVLDILDPFETTKYKTTRALNGYFNTTSADTSRIYMWSGNWRNTSALTSISFEPESGSFIAGSRISLYGLKGA